MTTTYCCADCGREMDGGGCAHDSVTRRNMLYPCVPYGQESTWEQFSVRPADTCRDCGVRFGLMHHASCCIEECPACHGQMLTCRCDDAWELWNDGWNIPQIARELRLPASHVRAYVDTFGARA